LSDETITENKSYDNLTPQRKVLVDQVMKNLESGNGLWTPGWKMSGVPESAVTGKKYHGVNNFYLTIISMMKGYSDNRWATFKQIEDKGWKFKTDEEGKSLGKGAGVTIEFFELRDSETKQTFDRHVLDGMTADEKQEYMKDNVYPVRRYYRVFNGDVIDGIPEREKQEVDPSGRVERADKILEYWNDNEAKIIYGGNSAFYRPSTDEIHLPPKIVFVDMQEFYSTALHEVGHSTGHSSRLNRDLSSGFGTDGYAQEELRAEIASMFMEQDLEIDVSEKHIENNSRYIKSWHDGIKENPNALFLAIADADKIAKYVMEKERLATIQKNTELLIVLINKLCKQCMQIIIRRTMNVFKDK
jgi:antirestriction protein ArdC